MCGIFVVVCFAEPSSQDNGATAQQISLDLILALLQSVWNLSGEDGKDYPSESESNVAM